MHIPLVILRKVLEMAANVEREFLNTYQELKVAHAAIVRARDYLEADGHCQDDTDCRACEAFRTLVEYLPSNTRKEADK